MRRQRTGEDLAIDTIVLVVMVLVSLSIVYPFWKMLVDSFSTPAAAIKMGLKLLPEEASLQSYREVFSKNSVAIGYLNTLIRTISGTVLTLVVCMLAAYPKFNIHTGDARKFRVISCDSCRSTKDPALKSAQLAKVVPYSFETPLSAALRTITLPPRFSVPTLED